MQVVIKGTFFYRGLEVVELKEPRKATPGTTSLKFDKERRVLNGSF